MADHRKTPAESSSRTGRHDSATMSSDSGKFAIENTTARLKSLRLRRAEVGNQGVAEAVKAATSRSAEDNPDDSGSRPSGRVRHDERGVAIWDFSVASGKFTTLSTSVALKKLEVEELKIDDARPAELKLSVTGRDKAGGFDPYNQRGTGKRQGEAAKRAGITGSPGRYRAAADPFAGKKK